MDVSHRLIPETNVLGMLGDVKRAVAWLKRNASRYRVSPDRIVLGGRWTPSSRGLCSRVSSEEPIAHRRNRKDAVQREKNDWGHRREVDACGPRRRAVGAQQSCVDERQAECAEARVMQPSPRSRADVPTDVKADDEQQ